MASSAPNSRILRYYSKLVETYIQLSLYEEAEATATRVLTVDPSNSTLVVRLKRGHARRRFGNLVGALVDFETVLSYPPKPDTPQVLHHDEALRQRDIVVNALGFSYDQLVLVHASQVAKYNEPAYTEVSSSLDDKDLLDEPFNSSCRFYNHSGCRRKKCLFSHAPDARSIRDNRGRNVCLYFLVGRCKWDMFTCIYCHSKDDLPSEYKVEDETRVAWWDDLERCEVVRDLIVKRDTERKRIHELNELAKQRNTNKSKKKKKKNRSGDSKAVTTQNKAASSSSQSNGDETLVFEWESESESEDELEDA
ncbi:hypothetical protein BDP27DRAFT_1314880 [Rhodocollybia butyracea]|uniref:C3H1-type domain-containing protein n=1 Tax=Rhodocollybia butyracea TaxID=206335 RepID=A0A9P5Q5Y2_9AGAR|nr:hypothetical protein BDP27DRAFT_1314880 [Rhodocollybia butyracea]